MVSPQTVFTYFDIDYSKWIFTIFLVNDTKNDIFTGLLFNQRFHKSP